MRKKRVYIIVSILLVLICSIALSGCNLVIDGGWFDKADFLPEYESGYFRYAVKTFEDGKKEAYIVGLTESGLQQSALIFPTEIDGITVYGTTYKIESIIVTGTPKFVGELDSENLDKIFFTQSPSKAAGTRVTIATSQNVYKVFWNLEDSLSPNKNMIIGYNYYIEKGFVDALHNSHIANISYLYNYEDSPNCGYYWVDSYDESIITFIPPKPKRDGYEFGGWYKESECINEWVFETDTSGKEISIGDDYIDTYQGKYLYAKWIIKNK